jgi:glucokinase
MDERVLMPATPAHGSTGSRLRGGIDLGGTKIQAIVVDADHQVRGQARAKTPTDKGATGVIGALASTLRKAAEDAGCDVSTLAGVGIGSPGAVDAHLGTVTGARNLAGFDDTVTMATLVSDAVGIPCFLGNDVGVALDAEAKLGSVANAHSFLGVWWGTGIGGGFVVDGKRWLGRGAAGEIGHVVVKMGGARCPCGRRGCLEAYAGRRAMELQAQRLVDRGRHTRLFDWAHKKGEDHLTSSVWAKALEKEDAVTVHLIDRAVRALGAGIASAVNLLDVEAVVIGGGLGTRFGEPMAERIAAAMRPHLLLPDRPPRVSVSHLGDLGGAVGASLLVPSG